MTHNDFLPHLNFTFLVGSLQKVQPPDSGRVTSINQNTYPDATLNFRIEALCGIQNIHVISDSGLPIHMGLEYQPGMLSQSMELNKLPALLSDTQFRPE